MFDEIKTRLEDLAHEKGETVEDLSEIVNKKENGLKIDCTHIGVYRPEAKRIIAFIGPTCKELEELDNVVPDILKTLVNKSKEYCEADSNLITQGVGYQSAPYNYYNTANQINNAFNMNKMQMNKNERLLNEAHLHDPNYVVLTRYNIQITNLEIGSLQEGRKPSSKVINMVYSYIQDVVNSGSEVLHTQIHANEVQTEKKDLTPDMVNLAATQHFRNRLLMLSIQYFHNLAISHNDIDLSGTIYLYTNLYRLEKRNQAVHRLQKDHLRRFRPYPTPHHNRRRTLLHPRNQKPQRVPSPTNDQQLLFKPTLPLTRNHFIRL